MTKKQRDALNAKLGDMWIMSDGGIEGGINERIEFIAYPLEDGITDESRPIRVTIYIDDPKVLAEAIKEGVL